VTASLNSRFHFRPAACALLAALFLAVRPATPAAVEAPAPKIKVLIVDGFSNHDWQHTTALIQAILAPTALFEVAVSTSPATAAAPGWDTWRPRFKAYDVVIQNCNDIKGGPSWPREVQIAFEDFVRDGGGVYIFHSAQNAFADWPAYNQIIGLGWRKKTYGTAIAIADDGKLVRYPPGEGQDTSHAPNGDVIVRQLGAHPIHAGLPPAWKTPHLEVYYAARGPAENVEVLSYARDPRFGQNWPVEWTVTYGRGRTYIATFGHVWKGDDEPESLRCAGVQTMIVRAVQWLAGRPVTFPVPTDFPTAETKSLRPEFKLAPTPH
jgi:type 1 glutamine amidotransferase